MIKPARRGSLNVVCGEASKPAQLRLQQSPTRQASSLSVNESGRRGFLVGVGAGLLLIGNSAEAKNFKEMVREREQRKRAMRESLKKVKEQANQPPASE